MIGLGLVQTPRPTTIPVKPIPPVPPGGGAAGPAVITFGLSYLIGTELNGRFFHIGLDDGSVTADNEDGEFCYTQACAPRLHWSNYGDTIYYGAKVTQFPGAYLYSAKLNGSRYTPVRWFRAPCTFSGFLSPPGSSLMTGAAGVNCKYGYQLYAPVTVETPYRTIEDTLREIPRPYVPERDGQPDITLPAPADPGIGTAETRAEAELEGNKALLRAGLDWNADPNHVAKEEPGRRPEPGRPGQGFDRNRQCNLAQFGTPRYIPRQDPSAIKATYLAALPGGGSTTVYLRYGETVGYNDRAGWGYRHIAYKHGWGPGDAADTALTLEAPTGEPIPQDERGDSFRYERAYTGAGGAACRRVVVVAFNDDPDDGVAGPKYVITSYIEGP